MATEPASAAGPQLAVYLSTLRRRKWTILVVTLLAVGAAIGLSKSQTPTYQSTTRVLLQTSQSQVDTALGITNTPYNIPDEIARLQSPAVANLVVRQIGTAPGVSATNPAGTDLMVITATATSPQLAANIANAYAKAYIQERQTSAISSYLDAAKVPQAQITSLQAQIAQIQAQIAPLQAQLAATAGQTADAQTAAWQQQVTRLQAQITPLQAQITLLQQEANTLQTEASIGASGALVITPATPNPAPVSPRTLRNGVIGFAGGLVLGLGLAFLRESLDDTIVSREDLDRSQPGLPVLGVLPSMSGREKDLVSTARPHSYAAESFRSLRTSVQFLGLDQPVKLLQITSPRTAEGKTTIVANLALTFAAAGQRVIAVDCDLRRSRLHSVFGLSNKLGFSSVLVGQSPLSSALQPVEDHDNLSVLTSGERPTNPAELLSGPRAREVFSALEQLADIVIVDCPPVLPVTDAALIATAMNATLLVVSSGTTTGKDLTNSLETLSQVDAPVMGLVLNVVEVNAGYRYRYRYRYSYEPRHSVTAEQQ